MELRHLRYFVAVAKSQNVTRAASQLHISQPALSRQIHDLECEIGVKLLLRTPNSVRLTPDGKYFLQECTAILNRVDAAVSKIRAKSRGSDPVVRIGYAATPAAEILQRSMEKFQKLHPNTTIELSDLSSNGIVKGIHENVLDLGVTVSISPQSFEGLSLEQLGSYELSVAFPKKHRFTRFKRVPLSEVAAEKLVTFSQKEHPEAALAFRRILSPYTPELNFVMECDSISSLIAGIEAGKGVALGFSTMAKIAGNRLVVRPVKPAAWRLPIGVIYNDQKLSDAAAAFLAVLKSVKIKSPKDSGEALFL